MTRLNKISNRAMRTGRPTDEVKRQVTKERAYDRANTRWIAEMQAKYQVPYLSEQEFDEADLTTVNDRRRYMEIAEEELALVT